MPHTHTQHYLVLIRLQCKTSFVMSFTISKWLKKGYSKINFEYMYLYYSCNTFDPLNTCLEDLGNISGFFSWIYEHQNIKVLS